jgi:GTPase KRas
VARETRSLNELDSAKLSVTSRLTLEHFAEEEWANQRSLDLRFLIASKTVKQPVMAVCLLFVVGKAGVGKSALTLQIVNGFFVEDFDPSIEDYYRKGRVVDNESYLLEIHDTCGSEYCALYINNFDHGEGFLCTYSITDRSSFDQIATIREDLFRARRDRSIHGRKEKLIMILVGNKCDLEEERQVTEEEGQNLAKSFGCPFFEASAKDLVNVENAFYQLVREIRMDLSGMTEGLIRHRKCSLL